MIDLRYIKFEKIHTMLIPSMSASYLHYVMAIIDPDYKNVMPRRRYRPKAKTVANIDKKNEIDQMIQQMKVDFPARSDYSEIPYAHSITTRVSHADMVRIAKSLDATRETADLDFLKELEKQKECDNKDNYGYKLNRAAFIIKP